MNSSNVCQELNPRGGFTDLECARQHAHEVWSLELHGPVFDDRALAGALPSPRFELLELSGVSITGPGLRALQDLPRLRGLRARFGPISDLARTDLPVLENLESLTQSLLPPKLTSVTRIVEATPRLSELSLGSTSRTQVDGVLAFPKLEHLTLEFSEVPPCVIMPASLQWKPVSVGELERLRSR